MTTGSPSAIIGFSLGYNGRRYSASGRWGNAPEGIYSRLKAIGFNTVLLPTATKTPSLDAFKRSLKSLPALNTSPEHSCIMIDVNPLVKQMLLTSLDANRCLSAMSDLIKTVQERSKADKVILQFSGEIQPNQQGACDRPSQLLKMRELAKTTIPYASYVVDSKVMPVCFRKFMDAPPLPQSGDLVGVNYSRNRNTAWLPKTPENLPAGVSWFVVLWPYPSKISTSSRNF